MRRETIKLILHEKKRKKKKKKLKTPIGNLYSLKPVFSNPSVGTPEGIEEGLMLGYKKFPDKYFDSLTHKEFPKSEINKHPRWFKEEYDNNGKLIYHETYYGYWSRWEYDADGNQIYYETNNGYWIKKEYDTDGNLIYKENSDGFWEKWKYDEYGNEIYYEDSYGYIEDNRDQIQEGLMLSYKKFQDRYFDSTTYREFPREEINEHPKWYMWKYDKYGNGIYYKDSNGFWVECEYDADHNRIYEKHSTGFWQKWEYDKKENLMYYENSNGDIQDYRDLIQEGLMLGYKKFPDRYFDYYTDEEFPKSEINEHPDWFKEEYDKDGNAIYYERSDDYWEKREYDKDGNQIYVENSNGFWIKQEYDENNIEIYSEDSDGNVTDNRNNIQEGLNKQHKNTNQQVFNYLNQTIKQIEKSYDKTLDQDVFRLFYTKSNEKPNMIMKVSLEPNNHVVIHLCRERFINIILSKFKITKPEFISIFNDWFLKKYSKKIMTEGINLPTNNTKIVGDYPNGHWEKYQYDDNGNLIKFENAQNYWKKYEYNDRGKLIFLEDSNGYWEKIIYSEDGKKAKYNNSKGEWWEQQYDEKNRLIKYTKSDGYWEKRKYNDAGEVVYYETSFGKVRDKINNIQEGLMLSYKKFPDRYFDSRTGDEFPRSEINEHPRWYKEEYDDNGNKIYFENSYGHWVKYKYNQTGRQIYYENNRGYWEKWEFDNNGNKIYYENAKGYWEKREYDADGNKTYYEDSDGNIYDIRNQIQEGLMLPYKEKNNKFSDHWRNVEVSHGTMNTYDLVPIFFRLLKSQTWNQKIQDRIILLQEDWKTIQNKITQHGGETEEDGEEVGYFVQELFDFIDDLAPDGTSFGSSDGDGSSYGFWSYYDEKCPECGNKDITNINYSDGTAYCPYCRNEFEMGTYNF